MSRGRGTLFLAVSATVVILQFAAQTVLRNALWGSSVSLAQEAVRMSPGEWVPRLLLGETLRQTGRCAEAVPEYRAVLARHGIAAFTRVKLLGCLLKTDQIADARIVLQEMPEADRRALCGAVSGTQCQ